MRLVRFIPLLTLLLISGCATGIGGPTPTLTDKELLDIPETPMGLLPQPIDPESTAVPTVQVDSFGEGQVITTPNLGWTLYIPESWTVEEVEEAVYEIRDQNGDLAVTASQVVGLRIEPNAAEEDIANLLFAQGLTNADFEIDQQVIEISNYVRVRGKGIDACAYWYYPAIFTYGVLKFERSLCTESGELNETGFGIMRRATFPGPTQ